MWGARPAAPAIPALSPAPETGKIGVRGRLAWAINLVSDW